ncbi:MAG: DNA polymerase III subunit delta, partial [Bacteroidota bacterium]
MTYAEFTREIAAGQLRPAYVFLGEEEFLAEEGARAVIEAVLPEAERAFCLSELGAETQAAAAKQALCAPSFFGRNRVVRVREFGRLDAAVQEVLASLVERLPPGIHLVVGGPVDRKRKSVKQLLERAAMVECAACKRPEAVSWAQGRARQAGLTLAPEAAQLLVGTVGTSLRAIAVELEKAAVYLGGEREALTEADLRLLLGTEREDDVFKLVEAAGQGDAGQALRILGDLLALGEPEPVLLSLLARHVRQVLLAGHLRAAGKKSGEIASALGVPPFVAEKLLKQTVKLDFARCRRLLERMHLADVRGKTGERELRQELELVVLAMTAG